MSAERTINVSGNAQYIEYVENNYMNGVPVGKHGAQQGGMPDELNSDEAKNILRKLQKHGFLDENLRPLGLSTSESAVLAFQVCIVLSVKDVWKVFSTLWGTSPNALRAAYNRGINQKKTGDFLDEICPLLKM